MKRQPSLFVLAGVNGAGKSSVGESTFGGKRAVVYNPDTIAQRIRALHPGITLALANGQAWQIGKSLLEEAIAQGSEYRFETTLGGATIASLLEQAARSGHRLHVWFCGLGSPELHIRRVRARVASGGHDIPVEKIRERWTQSRLNLIRLLPYIHHLRLFDNSVEADLAAGKPPRPVLWLEMRQGRITAPKDLSGAPDWAQPILAAAMRLHLSNDKPHQPQGNPAAGYQTRRTG